MKRFSFSTLLLHPTLFSVLIGTCTTPETINSSYSLRYGETLVSPDHIFELGFFSLSDPDVKYLGIWYKMSPGTIIWVANRETPLSNTSGALNLTSQGNLVLFNITNNIVWSSNTSRTTAKYPVALLLDSGNLVLREADDNNADNFLWQSFNFPADTLLPGLKIGTNLVTGVETFISSWKSMNDLSPGQFSMHLDLHGYPQLVIKQRNRIQLRLGSWNGLRFTGTPLLKPNPSFTFEFVLNDYEVCYKYELLNSKRHQRSRLDPSGVIQRFSWDDQANDWRQLSVVSQKDPCESYALCGEYASCEIHKFWICACLDGFIPKNPNDWNMQIWSGGCVPRTPIHCDSQVGFLQNTGKKLPNISLSWYNKSIDLMECESLCLRNCACTAYANLDIRDGGSGCLLWFTGLIDMRGFDEGGQDIFVKMTASELAMIEKRKPSNNKKKAGIISGIVAMVIITLVIFCILRRNLRKQGIRRKSTKKTENNEEMELPMFDLATIADATNNFSSTNKLGQGGFGPVYKGTIKEGQEIAAKRLSKGSSQGLTEFKNEVILIAKLQHCNLVKLLGCCIHEDEKMLIYEYMPNKSLDSFIFDQTKSRLLDWHKRLNIINGIAQGLLYLHQDSILRIIHRDLKTSNILLDINMNPKISDFGLARTVWGDHTEYNTRRVVGTYGYMSPEYAVDGVFSVKSDVFSFGVLVLEIVSGKKNRGFYHPEHGHNLLGHAWMMWSKGTALELIDEYLAESCVPSEAKRCINVALLCVQQQPEDRPSMSSVVVMLSSEISLPKPKEPGFFLQRTPHEADASSNWCSANEVTISVLEAR